MHYTKTTLKNGMRVITVPMHDTKSLTLLVLFGTGSKYEVKRTMGVSHFLEHMFFKGTKSRPRPGQVHQELDDIGAEHNAFTGKEVTGYWVKADAKRFDLALDIVSDILLEPLFREEEIEKERGVIMQEMSMYLDTPTRRIHEIFETLLYGDQPAGWETVGTPETLHNLKRNDFLDYWQSQYVGSNAVVVIAGSIREGAALTAISEIFSRIPAGKPRPKLAVKERQKEPAAKIEHKETDQSHLVVGVRGYNMFKEERYAASLLATILGGKTSSRLFREIREKRGLAYALSASSEEYTDSGHLSVYAGVPHVKLKEVLRRITDAFKKVRGEGVPRIELERAKDYYRGKFAIGFESSDEVASYFGMQELFYRRILMPEDIMAKVDAVTTADLATVAEFMFQPKKLNVAVIGPHPQNADIASVLALQ